MSKKRKVYLHVGLPGGPGDFLEIALRRHTHALAALDVRNPASSTDEMFRAAVEIMRDHQAWGYERREVEGAWSGICRRGHKGRDTLVVSQPLLASATSAQIELLFDGLAGFERHVVITAAAPEAWTFPGDPAQDLGQVLERWAASARRPERVHVLVNRSGDRRRHLGGVRPHGRVRDRVALGGRPGGPADHATPPGTLGAATVLRALAHSWIDTLSRSEYDVRGDVTDLLPDLPQPSVA